MGADMEKNKWLAVASILAYVWTALLAISGVALGIPAFTGGHNIVLPVSMLVFAVALGASAYGIWRQRAPFQWIALVASTLLIFFHMILSSPVSGAGILVNLIIVGIVFANRRLFTSGRKAE
jgi:hypothetical protein